MHQQRQRVTGLGGEGHWWGCFEDATYSRLTWWMMPVPGGTTVTFSNDDDAHLKRPNRSTLRSNSCAIFTFNIIIIKIENDIMTSVVGGRRIISGEG